MPRFTKEVLLAHLDEVYEKVRSYIGQVSPQSLTEAAPGFFGKYTKYQVISMVLMDNVRHLGEIYALKAMWERVEGGGG